MVSQILLHVFLPQGTACPPLDVPDNGMIDCSIGGDGIAVPGDTCTYTCDDGYMVDGDMTITCGDDGSWSDNTRCKLIRKSCSLHCALNHDKIQCIDAV